MAKTHITGPEMSGEVAQGNLSARLVGSFGGTYDSAGKGTPGANAPAGLNPGSVAFSDTDRGVFNAVFSLARDLKPQAKTVGLIAAAQTLAAAGALTLANASVAGVGDAPRLTVFSDGQNQRRLRLDTPRCVSITAAAAATTRSYTVKGYDEYGVPLTEVIPTVGASTTVNGKKAFLDVTSVTADGATATNVSVDTTDILGFPFLAGKWAMIDVVFNDALIAATTGFTAGVATTATATTGDVRGTYALQSAADGVKSFQLFQFVPHAASTDPTLSYGKAQFS